MDLLNIRRAFEKKLAQITPSGVDTASEGISFEPTVGKPYQSTQLSPRIPENPSFGDNYWREVGEFQIFLCYPKDSNPSAIYTYAGNIQDTFYRGLSLTEADTIVTIRLTPSIRNAVILDDRYCIPVIIDYFANVYKP